MTRTHTRIISIVVAVAIVAAMLTAYRAGGWRMLLARDRAVRLFRARKFADADSAFHALVRTATHEHRLDLLPPLEFDLGNTAYRMGKFDNAQQEFHTAQAGSDRLRERALFNLGDTYVWQGRSDYDHGGKLREYSAAVEAFEDALVIDPHDADAKWNLEVALRRLADATGHYSTSLHRNEADWGGGNLTKSGYSGTPQTGAGATPGGGFGTGGGDESVPEITETQARKLLKAVERAQVSGQEIPGKMDHRGSGPLRERDW
jgi:tetratricopeptide (TPR) repeat protein